MASSSSSTTVDRIGRHEIAKITIHNKPAKGRRLKLGFVLKSSEWASRDLRQDFPKATEWAYVSEIKTGSLAEKSGVLLQDILCSYTSGDENPPKLMSSSEFEHLVGCAQYEKSFSFYVARKVAAPTPSKTNNAVANNGGVTLSFEISLRAKEYHRLSAVEQQQLLQDAKEDAKLNFGRERDAVLESLPTEFKEKFWQIGFVQWGRARQGKTFLPVLILSPYGMGPGKARDAWMQKYLARKEKGTLDKINHLVYWYGQPLYPPSDCCFSVVNQDAFIPWEDGKARSLHLTPKKGTQKKIAGLIQINEASLLTPTERRLTLPTVAELHELLCVDDLRRYSDAPTKAMNARTGVIVYTTPPSSAVRSQEPAPQPEEPTPAARSQEPAPPAKRRRLALPLARNNTTNSNQHGETNGRKPVVRVRHSPLIKRSNSPVKKETATATHTEGVATSQSGFLKEERTDMAFVPKKEEASLVPQTKLVSDIDASSLEEEEDRKVAARKCVVAEPSESVQRVLDTFCSRIQEISRRNAVLRVQHEQLKCQVKTWKDQYSVLGGIASCNIADTQQNAQDIDDNLLEGVQGDRGESYLNSMHIFLGKTEQQNSSLEQQNARLKREGEEWRARVVALVDELKQQRTSSN